MATTQSLEGNGLGSELSSSSQVVRVWWDPPGNGFPNKFTASLEMVTVDNTIFVRKLKGANSDVTDREYKCYTAQHCWKVLCLSTANPRTAATSTGLCLSKNTFLSGSFNVPISLLVCEKIMAFSHAIVIAGNTGQKPMFPCLSGRQTLISQQCLHILLQLTSARWLVIQPEWKSLLQ